MKRIFEFAKRNVMIIPLQLVIFFLYSAVTYALAQPIKCWEIPPFWNNVLIWAPFWHSGLLLFCVLLSALNKQTSWKYYFVSTIVLFLLGIGIFFVALEANLQKMCF